MKILVRLVFAVVLACVGAVAYLLIYGNMSSALRNGCFNPSATLRPVGDAQPHFQGFPPKFVCLYRNKAGRIVERPD